MIATLAAFFATWGGKAALAGFLVPMLGFLNKTAPYKGLRRAWGRLCYRAGQMVSAFGKTRLGGGWQPAENLLLDFGAFGVEQWAAGLRSDNPDKLEDQIERLKDVESVTRAKALADKLELLRATTLPLQDAQDAEIAYRAFQGAKKSIQDKLGQ